MSYEKVAPGTRFRQTAFYKSSFHNDLVSMLADYKRGLLNNRPPKAHGSESPTDIVKVRNGTGGALAKGNVVQLGAAILSKKSNRTPWFECDKPTDSSLPNGHARYAIMREPSPEGKIKQAQISGCCLATVLVTDDDHTHAFPVDDEVVLASGFAGPVELLEAPDGTGEQLLFVRLGLPQTIPLIVKPDGDIDKGSTGTVSIWGGASGSESDTGSNIENCSALGAAVEQDKFCTVVYLNGIPYVFPWEC